MPNIDLPDGVEEDHVLPPGLELASSPEVDDVDDDEEDEDEDE